MEQIADMRITRRILTPVVTFLAGASAVALAAVSLPAHAATNNFLTPVFSVPGPARSISVSGTGHASWRADGVTGSIGSEESPVNMDVCYTYTSPNTGATNATDMYAYVNQAPGRQDPTRRASDAQGSNPQYLGGSQLTINTFSSEDCTNLLVGEFRGGTVPDNEGPTFRVFLLG